MAQLDTHELLPLLRRALAGEADAWNAFFGAVRKYLHAVVRAELGPDAPGRLEHSALVQSTLRRAWERIGEQFPDGPEDGALRRFLAWAATIARNRSRDEWRRQQRQRTEAAGAAIEAVAEPRRRRRAEPRARLAVELTAALARLPERQRQVVELFWFEGLSDADISRGLDCSPGAVRVLRFRALRKLQSPTLQALLEESHDDQR
jgi:RNA polymerase sigma-70 factor, ECF subfamily